MKLDSQTFADLQDSWLRQLRAQRKSPHTLRVYRTALDSFLTYCTEANVTAPIFTKATVFEWMGAQNCATSTVRLRLTALKQFAKWLAAEEGFDPDPIHAVKPPKLDQQPVPDLSENEIMRMLKVCEGPSIARKRDKAMLLLLAEAGLRASELLGIDITDIDLDACVVRVIGKGRKPRTVRFSPGTAAAIDRYVRARRTAIPRPAEGPLWVSNQRRRLSHNGLVNTLTTRATAAGVLGFHIHRLRHTAAVRWLAKGGTESGLRAHCGWQDPAMVARYAKVASERLAQAEFERLGLGLVEL